MGASIAARVAALVLAVWWFSATAALAAPLAPAPVPAESFDVGTLHVDRYGSGAPALILLPGLTCGPWEWYGTIAHEQIAHTVYAVSLPGFDGRPGTTKPLFATVTSDLAALLDARKIVQPVVVGHSLGGTLAIALGEAYPTRLKEVVAVDGLPVFPTLAGAQPEQRAAAAAQAASAYNVPPAVLLANAKTFMSTYGTSDPALVDPTAVLIAKSDPATSAQWLKEDLSGDWRPDLKNITVPLVEIMPYYAPDHQQPPLQYTQDQTQQFYASILAGAPKLTLIPVPNARHFVMLDRPDAFYAALDRALNAM